MKYLNDNLKTVLPMSLFYQLTAKNPDQITESIKQFYFGGSEEITLDMMPNINKVNHFLIYLIYLIILLNLNI